MPFSYINKIRWAEALTKKIEIDESLVKYGSKISKKTFGLYGRQRLCW